MSPSWKHDRSHHLHVERPKADRSTRALPDGSVGLEDELVERLTPVEPLAERDGQILELTVREALVVGLDRGDVVGLLGQPLDAATLPHAEDSIERSEVTTGHA